MPLDDEWLTPGEIKTLAGVAGPEAQQRVLERDGIPYRQRGKRLLVSRFHVREWLAGRTVTPSRGINFDAIR